MARASTKTLIPLDRFAAVLGLDPLHFNSVYTDLRPDRFACDDMWAQYDWQNTGRVSRETIALALRQAEDTTARYLGYYPISAWVEEEEHMLPNPYRPELVYTTTRNTRFLGKSITTDRGLVNSFGIRAKTLIEEGAAVVFSDTKNDGYDDTATIAVATTTVTDIEEISVYFTGKSGADAWEIRPVDVSISGGTATITFPKVYATNPDLWEATAGDNSTFDAVDGDNNNNFVSSVDVYRVYNDPSQNATFYYPSTCLSCGNMGCDVCQESAETGCLQIRNQRLGHVTYARADWNTATLQYDSAQFSKAIQPERIKIWYRAGLVNRDSDYPHRRMDATWERAIVYYSLTLIDTNICGCANFKAITDHQLRDLAETKPSSGFNLSVKMLNNPFGTQRAAINLWKMVRRELLGTAR